MRESNNKGCFSPLPNTNGKMRKVYDPASTSHVQIAVYFPLISTRITKTHVGVTKSVSSKIVVWLLCINFRTQVIQLALVTQPATHNTHTHLTKRNRKLSAGTNPSPLGLELVYLFLLTASESLSDSVTVEEF